MLKIARGLRIAKSSKDVPVLNISGADPQVTYNNFEDEFMKDGIWQVR